MFNYYEIHQHEIDVVCNHRALKYGRHMHSEFEALYLLDGEQKIFVGGREYTLHKGDCAVIFPNVPHEYTRPESMEKHNNSAESVAVFMPAEAVYSMYPETRGYYPENCFISSNALDENAQLAFSKIFNETAGNTQIGWAYIIYSHTVPRLMKSNLLSERDLDKATRVLSYISMNFRKPLTIDNVSEELNISRSDISKIFSEYVKTGFKTYLSFLRANNAASLMKLSDNRLEYIAADSGFESPRALTRVFKKIYGVSPSQYRKAIRCSNGPMPIEHISE